MRALKSPLAKQLLADPDARQQLRQMTPVTGHVTEADGYVELRRGASQDVKYVVPRVVPKAA